MKKLFLSVLAIASLVACNKEDLIQTQAPSKIAFGDSFVENVTRTTTAYNRDNLISFDVYGTITKDGAVTNIFKGVEVKKTNSVWSYDDQYTQYWLAGYHYDFAAVVDGVVTPDANGMPETIAIDMTEQKDVLFATADCDFTATNTVETVTFTFNHMLAKAKFTVKNTMTAGSGFVYNVESIKIKNADKSGAYDVNNKAWTATGSYEADFGISAALAKDNQYVGQDVYLLPNASKDLDIEVKYNLTYNGTTLKEETKSLATKLNIEQGMAYNFVVEFGNPGEEILFNADVQDWANGSVEIFQGVSVPVANADEFVAAIANDEVGEVILVGDIDLNTSTITRSGESTPVIAKSFVINGNGKKLIYDGSDRVIDVTNKADNNNLVVTIKDLTIECTNSYCQRGINYNAGGLLIVDNVKFEGTAPTYAINLPSSSDNAVVKIKNSNIVGNIALSVWGKNVKIDVENTVLNSYENNAKEDYVAVRLNNNIDYSAENTVININGGEVIAYNENNEPSNAIINATLTGVVNVSETTKVVGSVAKQCAIVTFSDDPAKDFYGCFSLAEAIKTCVEDKGLRVRVTCDIELTESLAIKDGENVVLDLAGHTVSIVDKATKGNFELIKNQGNLTIVGPGKLVITDVDVNRGWGGYSAVVANTVGGNLVVDGGVVIEHLGGTDMAYGIDNLTNGKNTVAVTTIKNATVKSPYRATRQFLNGPEAKNELYVKAGAVIEGVNKSIWMHDPSAKANTGKLVVEAGAKLSGNVYLFVTEGSTEWPVEVSIASSTLVGESTVISGNVPDGYAVVEENGTWKVVSTK